ncbi:MAG: PAS domain S-box protein, partial [bacterium]
MILNARDVTERKNADEALRDRERYFRALTENASDVVYVMDRQGRRFYESASTEKVLGYAPGEREARDTFSYLHPEDLEAGKAAFREALESPGEPVPTELRTRHKDGRWIHMEVVATNLLDVAAVRGIVVNCRDITGRRKAEEDSRRSEERFRSLIEHSNDVISLVDAQGNNLYISPSLRKVMGYDPADRMGRNFFEMVHPEDLEWVRKDFTEFIREKDSVRRAQLRVKHSDGTWRWVEVTATQLLDQPAVGGIIFNYRDITEGKMAEADLMKSEENFRNLIEKSPDAMMAHTERMIHYVNGAWLRLLGYEAPEELIGGSPLSLVHPDDLEKIRIRIRQLSPSVDGYNPPRETRLLRKDGRVLDVETISFSILYGGEPMAVVVARDMSARKAAEQALLKYERLRALGEMAAGMAHEIRNPLFGIRLSAEYLLKKIDPPPEGRIQIQNILDQSERLGRLVDETLDYSKEKQALETRSVDALEMLRTSLRLAQVQYGPNHHRFQVRWESRDDLYLIQTNPYRVQQILVNLILNAFQAMGTEGTLTLSCGKRENRIEFVVRDDGSGISDKDMTRLFEPFFTTKSSGSGLGLSVSQKIAESHGGKIRVERGQPRGTAFILELPMEKEAS